MTIDMESITDWRRHARKVADGAAKLYTWTQVSKLLDGEWAYHLRYNREAIRNENIAIYTFSFLVSLYQIVTVV